MLLKKFQIWDYSEFRFLDEVTLHLCITATANDT
jgi:hypothetical protein